MIQRADFLTACVGCVCLGCMNGTRRHSARPFTERSDIRAAGEISCSHLRGSCKSLQISPSPRFDTYLVVQFHLLLFAEEAACTPWYGTLTSPLLESNSALLCSDHKEIHQIRCFCVTGPQMSRKSRVIPGKKICFLPSSISNSCALTTGIDSTPSCLCL